MFQEQRLLSLSKRWCQQGARVANDDSNWGQYPCHRDRWKLDDAQTNVKHMFNDVALREKLAANKMQFSSANSMNIGRLAPSGCLLRIRLCAIAVRQAKSQREKKSTLPSQQETLEISWQLSMPNKSVSPVGKLICASNENNVLTDFFKTHVYDKKREFKVTTSPSMDILVSSNLERLIFQFGRQ